MADDPKAVARRYFEDYHSGRQRELLDLLLGPELREATRSATERLEQAFPDYRITVDTQVAEGELVATVWHAEGTHQGSWESPLGPIAPTGRFVQWSATTTVRVRAGQIVELVGSHWDHLGLLQQLGALPEGVPRPGA
jgi:predicted ester cyclase